MTQPLLSIQIPTTPDRQIETNVLVNEIKNQCGIAAKEVKIVRGNIIILWVLSFVDFNVPVEIILGIDDKTLTIGEKREILYKESGGLYSWQIDSDDMIASNAIQLILEAIKSNPDVDVISFEEYVNIDGKEYKSNHHGKYLIWEGDGNSIFEDGFHFHRTPFFKSVIRTGLAKRVEIPHIRFGEDNIFADNLLPNIKTEIHIPEPLYRYIHTSSPHNERYGIDKD